MEDYIWLFVVIGLFTAGGVISWIIETISNSKKYIKLKSELDSLGKDKEEHLLRVKTEEERLDKKTRQLTEAFESAKNDLEKIAGQKSMGFPWLAEAYAEYFSLRDLRRAEYLEKKKHPALTAAETVKEIRNEKRELVKENKVVTYKLTYYQKLFPWLIDLIAEDETEEIPVQMEDGVTRNENKEDRVKEFLTPEEYKQLPSVERNQRALDRYLANRNKSKWALGRDYEMYVGYLYQQKGYSIEYKGIIDGYADLGRDIIAIKDNEVCIIQCKYWAKYKEIHEKHVFQLFGTTMEYWIRNSRNRGRQRGFEELMKFLSEAKLRPIFFTSTGLSATAKEMANALSIDVVENEPIAEFPRIKCNINVDEVGGQTKIYHLPMDQQYDSTVIGNRPGEFFAFTVKEAEDAGFRRAFKHNF